MHEFAMMPSPVWVWGLPLAPLTQAEALDRIDDLVAAGRPEYFITANVHYAMLSAEDARLREVNANAAFILADGMPLVWASRLMRHPLPERVAGSDLIWSISQRAAERGYPIFLLGGAEGVADRASRRLRERFPDLRIAGTACPPFGQRTEAEEAELAAAIRASGAKILFVALGQPKGEFWLARHCESLGVPVCVQVGAALDFVAGNVRRAPRWLQRVGGEWLYRLLQEPRRLLSRYSRNLLFTLRMFLGRTRRTERDWKYDLYVGRRSPRESSAAAGAVPVAREERR